VCASAILNYIFKTTVVQILMLCLFLYVYVRGAFKF